MYRLSFAVLFAEQVVDGLDGVEGGQGHFDEDGVPVGHGSVPQAGKFLRLEGDGTFGLFADEASVGVDIFAEVEVTAVVVLGGADEVDGVEVGGVVEDGFLLRVFAVDLRGLDNL